MAVYCGINPVFVSRAKEIEQMTYHVADLQHKLEVKGRAHGEPYECLCRIRRKCADLLLKLYAEDSNIMLMDDLDARWVRLIVNYVHTVLLKDKRQAG